MAEVPHSIRPLPDHVINQIAAGEVIERPASVVKELVENSLDAGARRIIVDLRDGGLQTISVSDDGRGIPGHDLIGAITRHYTSKLSCAEDLAAIATLGFRGEALASIAAVARIVVTSAISGAPTGHRLAAAPGMAHKLHPARHPLGTTIEVSELFFNTPPRRRFLKRARTEFLLIQQILKQMAFTRPEHEIELRHDGKRVFRLLPGAGFADEARISALLGRPFLRYANAVSEQFDAIRITGWVGLPGAARSLRDQQYLSVNGRVVTDRRLGHALRLAFEDTIPAGRHPCYALAIELPLAEVDVNVHPCKAEVRFAEPRLVHDALYLATTRAVRAGMASVAAAEAAPREVHEPRFWPGYGGRDRTPPSPGPRAGTTLAPDLRIVAGRWIFLLEPDRLLLVDGRALVSDIAEKALSRGERPRRRPLLLPIEIDASDPVLTIAAELHGLGFEVRLRDDGQGVLHTVPVALPEFNAAAFVDALRSTAQVTDLGRIVARAVATAWIPPQPVEAREALIAEIATRRSRTDICVELDPLACARLFASSARIDAN